MPKIAGSDDSKMLHRIVIITFPNCGSLNFKTIKRHYKFIFDSETYKLKCKLSIILFLTL